jgi:hypothetical protein
MELKTISLGIEFFPKVMRLMDNDNNNSSLGDLLPWLIEARDLCFVLHLPT